MDLQGKIALVTGGGRDIGGACVRQLAKAGAKVVVNYYQSGERAEALIAEVKADGGEAFALQGDMTDQADVDALIAKTIETHGRIDILMHITGGIIARKTLSEMSIDHWAAVMDLNVTSLVRVVKAAVPHMTEGGSIVTMASQAARDGGGPGAMAYGASKGAVMTLTRGLAKELGPKIRVNSMCPGMIDTDFHNTFTKPEVRKNVAAATPLRREGTSDDVAKLAVYLASDDAAFITGTNVDINGGTLFS